MLNTTGAVICRRRPTCLPNSLTRSAKSKQDYTTGRTDNESGAHDGDSFRFFLFSLLSILLLVLLLRRQLSFESHTLTHTHPVV